jgi:hypothetical protein
LYFFFFARNDGWAYRVHNSKLSAKFEMARGGMVSYCQILARARVLMAMLSNYGARIGRRGDPAISCSLSKVCFNCGSIAFLQCEHLQ